MRGRTEPFSASCFQIERSNGGCLFLSAPWRDCRLSGEVSSRSHTRSSAADLSSNTAARSCEADWASFPMSVAGAMVCGACWSARSLFVSSSTSFPCLTNICVSNWGENKRGGEELGHSSAQIYAV